MDHFEVEVDTEQSRTINIKLPYKTRKNGTLFIHAFLAKKSFKSNWKAAMSDPSTTYTVASLTQYHVPAELAFNLLNDDQKVKRMSLNNIASVRICFTFSYFMNRVRRRRWGSMMASR